MNGPARRKVSNVVFDLGKVLVDWNPRYLFVRHLGMRPDDAERFLTEVCSADWHVEFDRGRTFEDGVRRLSDLHPQHGRWIESYAREWPKMFDGPIDSSVEQLYALHERGITLHALSNYPPQQIRFLYERFEFMQLFHTVVISGLLNVIKPEQEIFERLLSSIGSDTCVFIDDSEQNVIAARAAGLEAIHFTPGDGPKRLAEFVSTVDAL